VQRTSVEELHSEERLAGAGGAVDDRGAVPGQAAFEDRIQAGDVGGGLLEMPRLHLATGHVPGVARDGGS
jgi:hypothetical protein